MARSNLQTIDPITGQASIRPVRDRRGVAVRRGGQRGRRLVRQVVRGAPGHGPRVATSSPARLRRSTPGSTRRGSSFSRDSRTACSSGGPRSSWRSRTGALADPERAVSVRGDAQRGLGYVAGQRRDAPHDGARLAPRALWRDDSARVRRALWPRVSRRRPDVLHAAVGGPAAARGTSCRPPSKWQAVFAKELSPGAIRRER